MDSFIACAKSLLGKGIIFGSIGLAAAIAQERPTQSPDELAASARARISALRMDPGAKYEVVRGVPGVVVRPREDKPPSPSCTPSTNLKLFIPQEGIKIEPPSRDEIASNIKSASAGAPFGPGQPFETPASLACVYNRVPVNAVPGCVPDYSDINPSGGSGAAAIVVAYDTPGVVSDLITFSQQFGLPPANVTIVYANGVQPPDSVTGDPLHGMWDIELRLDTQWFHAMAPNVANIFMVEFDPSAPSVDCVSPVGQAIDLATSLVKQNGGGQVNMSFTLNIDGNTSPSETQFNTAHFMPTPGVVYVAATGDIAGLPGYPAASSTVLAAGGTMINRNPNTNAFVSEEVWFNGYSLGTPVGAGAGLNLYETRPSWQDGVANVVGTQRGLPDVSFSAEPVQYMVYNGTWQLIGGTSLSSPAIAGTINVANSFLNNGVAQQTNTSPSVLNTMYGAYGAGQAAFGNAQNTLGMALGVTASTTVADSNGDGVVNVVDVQNAFLAASSEYSGGGTGFRDIVLGSVPYSLPPFGTLYATYGYDLASGLGVPYGYAGFAVGGTTQQFGQTNSPSGSIRPNAALPIMAGKLDR